MAEPTDVVGDVTSAVDVSEVGHRREQHSARRTEALSLRLAGLTYEQIGDRLGISPQGAADLIVRTLERAENLQVEQMRMLEGQRLDRAQAAIWTQVLEGNVKAVDAYLRISQRRAKLYGMDAPTRLEVNATIRQEMMTALDTLQQVVLGEVLSSDDEG